MMWECMWCGSVYSVEVYVVWECMDVGVYVEWKCMVCGSVWGVGAFGGVGVNGCDSVWVRYCMGCGSVGICMYGVL